MNESQIKARIKYRNSAKYKRWQRRYNAIKMKRYRERHKNDPEWSARVKAEKREYWKRLRKDPIRYAKHRAYNKKRSARLRRSAKWRAELSRQYKARALRRWLKIVGWTVEQDKEMRRKGCSICGKKKKKIVRDHDHQTGKGRGLLCDGCNVMLGWIEKRDIAVIVEYLKRGKT